MTTPPAEVQPPLDSAPTTFDPEATWVQGGVTYVPAPDVPVEPLPGEPGHAG